MPETDARSVESAPSVAYPVLAEFGGRRRKAMLGAWRVPHQWRTQFGRVWRTGAGRRCSEHGECPISGVASLAEFGGRRRKAMLGAWRVPHQWRNQFGRVWRTAPEGDARERGECPISGVASLAEFGGTAPEGDARERGECPISGVPSLAEFGGRRRKAMLGAWRVPHQWRTQFGRVWRTAPEGDARSVESAPSVA